MTGGTVLTGIFFITLFLLGVDSAFSMVEACSVAILDTNWGKKLFKDRRWFINLILCVVGFGISIL